ncbi:MAG: hypothetical protein ACPG47_00340 [Leucothrix sp.]
MKAFEPIKVHNCKSCGYPMRQFNPDSVMMVCESCGARFGQNVAPRYKPEAPHNPLFKLHEQFERNGVTWQIIGVQSYSGSVEEWDSEDKAWESTPWSYHTWWIINEAREIAWISQDKTGYSWSHKRTVTSGIPVGDKSYEVGHWTMTLAVGEFSYIPREAEQVRSYEKNNRSLEILLDTNGKNQEIEAFQAVQLDLMELLENFGKQSVVGALKRSKTATRAAFISIALLIVGFFVLQGFEKTLLTSPSVSIAGQSLKKVIPLGEFKMDSQGLIEIDILGNLARSDGNFDAEVVVSDSDKTPVAELPISLWRESGYDSDGAWTERQYRDAPRINLPAADVYTLSLVPDKLTGWQSISLRGKVTRNVVSLFPIILGSIAALLLGFFISLRRRGRVRRETGVGL